MKERPILMSGDTVRAILKGRKTQTRRPVITPKGIQQSYARLEWTKGKTDWNHLAYDAMLEDGKWSFLVAGDHGWDGAIACPFGQPGDRLWVRETWRIGAWREDGRMAIDYAASPKLTHTPWVMIPNDDDGEKFNRIWIDLCDQLKARGVEPDPNDGEYHWEPGQVPLPWRPSIHMPRWASRLTLEVVDIRVQRLQQITAKEALAEGLTRDEIFCLTIFCAPFNSKYASIEPDARCAFAQKWDAIYAKRGLSWGSDPWVWVITFRRIEDGGAS